MKITAAILATITGWYLFQRFTAGNAYAQTNNTPFLGVDLSSLYTGGKQVKKLQYFTQSEFGEWWPDMSTELLTKLDEFRARLGSPVKISPANGSLGRHLGVSMSQHNIDMWGEVRAADVMISNSISLEHAYQIAKEVGFTGIGVYPDWKPEHGLHLDVRQAPLALWSGFLNSTGHVYKSIQVAFS